MVKTTVDGAKLFTWAEDSPEPFVENVPQALAYTKTLKTLKHNYTAWRSCHDDAILLGSWGTSTITCLDTDGKEKIYNVEQRQFIISGLAITNIKQLVCTRGDLYDMEDSKVYSLNLEDEASKPIHPVNILNVKNPTRLCRVDAVEYGILCMNPSRIEFFSKRSVLLDESPAHQGSISLQMKNPHSWDSVCALDRHIYVASYIDAVVHVHNFWGIGMQSIGFSAKTISRGIMLLNEVHYDTNKPGQLDSPLSLQACGEVVIVTCATGAVHIVHDNKWKLLMDPWSKKSSDSETKFCQTIFTNTNMFGIDWYDCTKIHIYKTS